MPHIKGKGQGRAWRESASFPGHGEESADVQGAANTLRRWTEKGLVGMSRGLFRGGEAAAPRPGAAAEVTDLRRDWTDV